MRAPARAAKKERANMESKADASRAALPALDHETFLRRAFDVARRSREHGDHPFGAILVGPDGAILEEQGNGYSSEGGDMTAHAERLLATWASKTLGAAVLARCTLYSSAEPCAMCSAAIYWAGVGRVVYGQSEKSLKAMTGAHDENPTLNLPCRVVFAAGQRAVEVVGPLLEDEAAALQRDFWAEKARL
jgi:tRNA(Arg) A34 adenosine deaminase TadA